MRLLSLLLCCVLLTACDSVADIPRNDRPIVYKTSVSLLEDMQGFHTISERFWPLTMKRFSPERIYVTEDGLYIVLKSLFISEHGYFIPRADWQMETMSRTYSFMGDGIYSYEVKS